MAKVAIEGAVQRPPVSIGDEYQKLITALVRRMGDEMKREISKVFEETTNPIEKLSAMDASPTNQIKAALNKVRAKYDKLFGKVAKDATEKMMSRTLKAVDASAKATLKELSKHATLDPNVAMTGIMREMIAASTEEAVGLIKLIPQKYHTEVQTAVMRSIAGGEGMKDLVPFLTDKYNGNIRHARNVAMDQTRKVYTQLSAARMQAAGVKEFKWLHTSGSKEPRQSHIELSGKIFRYDDPPLIGKMYGKDVYGIGGMLPHCRCVCRPILNFDDE